MSRRKQLFIEGITYGSFAGFAWSILNNYALAVVLYALTQTVACLLVWRSLLVRSVTTDSGSNT